MANEFPRLSSFRVDGIQHILEIKHHRLQIYHRMAPIKPSTPRRSSSPIPRSPTPPMHDNSLHSQHSLLSTDPVIAERPPDVATINLPLPSPERAKSKPVPAERTTVSAIPPRVTFRPSEQHELALKAACRGESIFINGVAGLCVHFLKSGPKFIISTGSGKTSLLELIIRSLVLKPSFSVIVTSGNGAILNLGWYFCLL
jgi:hypothetical protein